MTMWIIYVFSAQTLCRLPFGLTEFRSSLFVILANRISEDPSLDQSWRFFLNCNRDNEEIIRTWESHEYLKPESPGNTNDDEAGDDEKQDTTRKETMSIDAADSVTFFRSLFKDLNQTGSRKKIPETKFICDPINSNILIEVQLRKIMPSNARPYLIDCYTLDGNNEATLSSTMLLKQGDDLRKDLSVMLMFKYMNDVWKSNGVVYNGQQCESLVYRVVPMSIDFGAIEFIPGVTKIANIDSVFDAKKGNDKELKAKMDKLIATSAAAYVASYICGVRDRHHDNILVGDDGRLFNIDFSHILGETLGGLDAAKIAIPKKFVKILGDENWNKFLEVVVSCYRVLRANYIQLVDYSRIVFAFMNRDRENEEYLKESLMIDFEDEQALKKIKTLFQQAPKNKKTKMKNFVHSLAVKGKQKIEK